MTQVAEDTNRMTTPGGEVPVLSGELDAILAAGSVEAHFQPIVSLKKKSVIGVEALARAWVPRSGERVDPLRIFRWAAAENRSSELDRFCRTRALEGFGPLGLLPHPPLLFLNF